MWRLNFQFQIVNLKWVYLSFYLMEKLLLICFENLFELSTNIYLSIDLKFGWYYGEKWRWRKCGTEMTHFSKMDISWDTKFQMTWFKRLWIAKTHGYNIYWGHYLQVYARVKNYSYKVRVRKSSLTHFSGK